MNYSIDGNQVCVTDVGFQCLATCHAGFGDSLKEAYLDYYRTAQRLPVLRDCEEWEIPWANELTDEYHVAVVI